MKENVKYEIQRMRMQSCGFKTDYRNYTYDMNSAVCLIFRWFLAIVFMICGITFPNINESTIPVEFRNIPEYISVNYSIEDMSDFIDSMVN